MKHALSSTHIFLPQQSQVKLIGCTHLGAREPLFHLQLQFLAESHRTSPKLKIAACTYFGKEVLFKGLLQWQSN